MQLTVTEKALIDLQRQGNAMAKRRKMLGKEDIGMEDIGGHPYPPEMVDQLAAPVRLEISFKDPIATRQQIESLMAALTEALVVTQDHKRGIVRQRLDTRNIIKIASNVLVYMNGKLPSGKKRRALP